MLKRLCRDTLLVAIAAALLLPLLGYSEVYQVSEGREGVVVHSILESHEYILPLRHSEIVPSKPPLFHWLSAAVYRSLNATPEFELRAVSAFAALALTLTLVLFLESVAGGAAAVIGAAILLSTEGFVRMAADGRVDMLFCFLVSAAILVWLRSYLSVFAGKFSLQDIPSRTYVSVALLSGAAVLAKGPLGLLLPVMIFSALVTMDFGVRSLKVLLRPSWLLVAALSLPWYVAAALKGKTAFVARQVIFENFQRFIGGEGISKKPFYFYFEQFWLHAAPWSLILVCYVFVLAREYYRRRRDPHYQSLIWPQNPTHRLIMKRCAVWALTLFIFFSLSAGKRSAYLLMTLPPLTIFLSLAFVSGAERLNFFRDTASPGIAGKVQALGSVIWLLLASLGGLFWIGRRFFPDAAGLPVSAGAQRSLRAMFDATLGWGPQLEIYFLGLLLLSGALWLVAFRRRKFSLFLLSTFALYQLFDIVFVGTALAGKGKTHGYKQLAQDVSSQVPTDVPLTFVKKKRDESFDGFFFYMNRTVRLYEPTGALDGTGVPSEPGLYLSRRAWLEEQPDQFTRRTETLLSGGRRVDSPDREVVLFRLVPETTEGTPPASEATHPEPRLTDSSGDADDSE
ncbi:MAG: glycosyltransferase family 39 protein [Bdellovibrionota bacterium]